MIGVSEGLERVVILLYTELLLPLFIISLFSFSLFSLLR